MVNESLMIFRVIILSLQLVGFTVLLVGMSCYNNVIIPQLIRRVVVLIGRHRPPPSDEVRVINAAGDPEQGI